MACTRCEPRRAPDTIRVGGDVRDPLLRAACHWFDRLRCEVAAHERECDCGLLARQEDVERFDSERAALALCMIDDVHGGADAISVTKREHCDHQTTCEIELVVQRSAQRPVLRFERSACR